MAFVVRASRVSYPKVCGYVPRICPVSSTGARVITSWRLLAVSDNVEHCVRFMSTPSNWKSPSELAKENKATLNHLPVPGGSWQDFQGARNSKWNKFVIASGAFFGLTVYAMFKTGVLYFHDKPDYKKVPVDATKPLSDQPKELKVSEEDLSGSSSGGPTKIPAWKPPPPEKIAEYKLPEKVQYLIIGAGTAAFAAFRSIRGKDPKAQVLLIGEEPYRPYMRPPLSKELWYSPDKDSVENMNFKQWNSKERSIFYELEQYFAKPEELHDLEYGGVALARGKKVEKIDVDRQIIFTSTGEEVQYEKCLIATGGEPMNLPAIEKAGSEVEKRTTLFRSILDFKKLDFITKHASSVAIIGGGFLGSELACALANRKTERDGKMEVYQVFPESGNMGRVLPEYLSQWTTEKVQKEGANVLPNTLVQGASYNPSNKKVVLTLDNGRKLSVDHVVVAVGIKANTDLAKSSRLEVDPVHGGFLVNAELEARKNLWVAGDAACFYDIQLGRRRVEHHDHAVVSGRLAGENMVGGSKAYWHQSMFWSDLGPEVGYEAIGVIDSSLPTLAVFAKATADDTPKAVVEKTGESLRSETEQEASSNSSEVISQEDSDEDSFGKGVIFYIRDKTVVGLLLWNVFGKMPVARKILRDQVHEDDVTEAAKLFRLHQASAPQETEANDAEETLPLPQ